MRYPSRSDESATHSCATRFSLVVSCWVVSTGHLVADWAIVLYGCGGSNAPFLGNLRVHSATKNGRTRFSVWKTLLPYEKTSAFLAHGAGSRLASFARRTLRRLFSTYS